ncbi:MAG: hypothetical protein E7433_01290 [Ruminococcaceae bacterium]|nr:hypothetical protein [Oscillospiraceae bacterium]
MYYFGLTNIFTYNTGTIIMQIILPLSLCAGYIVLLRAVKLNAPGIFAILGAAFCLMVMIWNFSTGDILRILLSVVFYLLSGLVLLATAGGYLPGRLLSSGLFLALLVFRYLMYAPSFRHIGQFILELSVLCIPASLFCLTRCMKEVKNRSKTDA